MRINAILYFVLRTVIFRRLWRVKICQKPTRFQTPADLLLSSSNCGPRSRRMKCCFAWSSNLRFWKVLDSFHIFHMDNNGLNLTLPFSTFLPVHSYLWVAYLSIQFRCQGINILQGEQWTDKNPMNGYRNTST